MGIDNEPTNDLSQDTGSGNDGGNPAWGELLSAIPEALHSQVTPHLTKWDEGVQSRINEVQSRYQGWDPFLQNNISPEDAANALQIAHSIRHDPRGFYDEMGAYYKYNVATQQAQQAIEDTESDESQQFQDPRFSSLQEKMDLMARIIVEQRQQEQYKQQVEQENQILDQQLGALKQKLGDKYAANEGLILNALSNGFKTADDAWAFIESVSKTAAPPPRNSYAPPVMGSGGSIPMAGNKHPSQMNDDETAAVMISMLQNANRQRQ